MIDINFQGSDWAIFTTWLLDQQQDTYKRLVSISNTEEETQRLRGRALFIEQLLDLRNNPAA
jgi:hypothetical protein